MADKVLNVRIQQKYDTEANWKSKDPILLKGEQAFTSDGSNKNKYKVGDGTSKWSALTYAKADLSKGDVTTALGYTPPTSNTWRGIQNNLTSDSTTDSLAAAQGKVLKGLVDGKVDNNESGADSLLSKLTTSWTAAPTDDTYFVRQDNGGGNTFGRVKFATLWSYVKDKTDAVYQPKGSYAASGHTHDDRYYTETEMNTKLATKLDKTGGLITDGTIAMNSAGLPTFGGTKVPASQTALGKNGIAISGIDTANDGAAIFMENSGTEINKLIIALGDDATQNGEKDYIAFRYYDTSGKVTYESKIPSKSGTIALTSDIAWANIANKPSTFAPSTHTHTKSQITDFPTSMPASDVSAWAKAATKPSYTKAEVGLGSVDNTADANKSVKYAASAGSSSAVSHTLLTNNDLDTLKTQGKWYYASGSNTCTNIPVSSGTAFELYVGRNADGYRYQRFVTLEGDVYIRRFNSSAWSAWKKLAFTSDTVTKTGSGASGTWGIGISGNAATSTKLATARSINGTNFDGSGNITTATWGTARTLTIGSTGKSVNGSGNVSWSLAEIGAAAASHTHSYLPLSGGTLSGGLYFSGHGKNGIYAGPNDAVNGPSGELNNLVVSSWFGVSFTTSCSNVTYTGKTAVGIDCRNGIVKAARFDGTLNGNASTASSAAKWTTARTLTLSGSVTGSVSIDGSGNVTLATTTAHTHSSVTDSGDGHVTTFAYSKDGLNYGDFTWLAAWNGYQLRAVNKNQFATAGHTHDDRYYTETEVNTKLSSKLGAVSANGYYGMTRPDGNTTDWIRTSSSGLLPYQNGQINNGHSAIGHKDWYFLNSYIDHMHSMDVIIADAVKLQYNSTTQSLNFVFS